MPDNITCVRCKGCFPPSHFAGARKRIVKHCAGCRGISLPGLDKSVTPSVLTPISSLAQRCSRSPCSSARSSRPRYNSPPPRPATDEAALEGRILSRLETHLDKRFDQLLARLGPAAPHQPNLLPFASPSGTTALPPTAPNNHGAPSNTVGESSLLSSSRCFPWVPLSVVELVAQDKLPAEQLVKLCNPESRVTHDPPQASSLIFEGGQLTLAEDSASQRTSSFIKAIPNLAALAHVWLVYTGIRVRSAQSSALHEALLSHLLNIIEFDSLFTWRAVVDYHLLVCRVRFGTGIVHEWSLTDQQIHSTVALLVAPTILPLPKPTPAVAAPTKVPMNLANGPTLASSALAEHDLTPASTATGHTQWSTAPTSRAPRPSPPSTSRRAYNLVSLPSHPGDMPFIGGMPSLRSPPPPSARHRSQPPLSASPQVPPILQASMPQNAQSLPLSSMPSRFPQPPIAPSRPTPPHGVQSAPLSSASRFAPPPSASLQVGPPPRAQPAPLSSATCPNLDSLAPAGIVDMTPAHALTLLASLLKGPPPPPQPNTWCERSIFDTANVPAMIGTLNLRYWSHFLDQYPDQAFAAQLRRALQHGVKLGYSGPLCNTPQLEVNNLPMDDANIDHLRRKIETGVLKGRLQPVDNPVDVKLVCSPVGSGTSGGWRSTAAAVRRNGAQAQKYSAGRWSSLDDFPEGNRQVASTRQPSRAERKKAPSGTNRRGVANGVQRRDGQGLVAIRDGEQDAWGEI
ncbi:uncharacterized protein UTRI_04671 [Ustilago trichophora]|uniref:Uncharacterized protein n=1 Tax=Ustilago trichophora TaxID=86804 RepID=A0A5C3EC78_9BASI|nr:uncharacterized protein UTRI_04671 [Ustilago trichophora]